MQFVWNLETNFLLNSNHVRGWNKSQYLFYYQKYLLLYCRNFFAISYRCHNLTYYGNSLCLKKKRQTALVIEIVKFVSVSKQVLKARSPVLKYLWNFFYYTCLPFSMIYINIVTIERFIEDNLIKVRRTPCLLGHDTEKLKRYRNIAEKLFWG